MQFGLIKEQTTRHFPTPRHPVGLTEVSRTYAVQDGEIVTTTTSDGRKRRFVIEEVSIFWKRSSPSMEPYRWSYLSVRGRTVLASGEVSKRSMGHASLWNDTGRQYWDVPDLIRTLADQANEQITA